MVKWIQRTVVEIVKNAGLVAFRNPSSVLLGKNLVESGIKRPNFAHAAHHIVAGKASGAAAARKVLANHNIGIDHAVNGVFLPTERGVSSAIYHPSLHTAVYYDKVNALLATAKSKKEVIEVLNYISEKLLDGTFMN